jgi:hypothetical protein
MVFMLEGCMIFTTSINRAKWLAGPGHPEDYYEGFASGCDSGLKKAGDMTSPYRIDGNKYVFNKPYRYGWVDGLDRCYNDKVKADREWREYRQELAIDKYLYENKE